MNILIIEDAQAIVDFIKIVLRVSLPEARLTTTHLGKTGVELVNQFKPNIVILDLGLPDMSGFDVLREIRQISSVPVLILSVRNSETAIAEGLSLGADDYLIKPARQLELIARINNLLRRHQADRPQGSVTHGALSLDCVTHEVKMGDRLVTLTKTESEILQQLIIAKGGIVTNSAISKAIWGSDFRTSGNIKVYIYQLRKKIESNPAHPKIILSKARVGYYLQSIDG